MKEKRLQRNLLLLWLCYFQRYSTLILLVLYSLYSLFRFCTIANEKQKCEIQRSIVNLFDSLNSAA